MTSEDFSRFRAYNRLNAIADVVTISIVMFFSYFLAAPIFNQVAIYGLCVLMAVFSLLWHTLIPEHFTGPTRLLVKHLADVLFVSLIIQYTGDARSPFFFLFYLIILAVAMSIGVRYTFLVAGVITISYIVMSGVAIEGLIAQPQSFIFTWANLASIWILSYLAAFLADEADKARRSVALAKEKVETFSKVDWLTGLYNMRHFDILSTQEIARSERYGRPCALLLIDADHLKAVNDQFGHQRGDQLIAELAHIISQQVRVSDTVMRYGGDEFIVMLPETDAMGARFLAERIRQSIEAHSIATGGRLIQPTVSIGVACYPIDASDAMGLLARADAALYVSKQAGRNRVTPYTEGMEGGIGREAPGPDPAAIISA